MCDKKKIRTEKEIFEPKKNFRTEKEIKNHKKSIPNWK
jgi:hypothetical protein